MENERRMEWLEVAVLGVAGLAWIRSAPFGPALLVALVPGALLLGSGVSLGAWRGGLRAIHFAALGGLLGTVLAPIAMLWAGVLGGVALAGLSAAGYLAAGARALRLEPHHDEVPDPPFTLRTAAEVAGDEVALAFAYVTAPISLRRRRERVREEIEAAIALFEARGWLAEPEKYHDAPPVLEDPQLSAARARGIDYEHLRFESGYSPHEDEPGRDRWLSYGPCRTAHAWVLRHPGPPRPWVVCIHGYQMGAPWVDIPAFRAEHLHRVLGVNVALPVLPLHGPRKIAHVSGTGFLSGELLDTVHAFAQAQWDLRRLLSWIRSQGDEPVGAYGLSLGGYNTALFASLNDGIACAIPGIPAVDIPRLAWRHAPPLELREVEDEPRLLERLEQLMRPVAPLALRPRVAHERRYIFGGSADRMVPPDQVRDLWRHWDRPRIFWYPGAHIAFLRHEEVHRFVDGALRESGLVRGVA